ncbi:MAG TPA: HD domain-containing protein [Rubrobacter sp.]|nr:HD domain-containing protein [Rubrobacter sp.]
MRASFLATDTTVRNDSRGVPYLSLKLVDRTGSVDARMWGKLPEEFLGEVPAPAYVAVEGHTHEYRGTLQVKLERLRLLRPEDVAEEDFLPATELDRMDLAGELEEAGRNLENGHLRDLFEVMVSDEDFWRRFCEAPAAKSMHHARVGGLLEHSVSCLRIARHLADLYPVDRDLLVFGAIFHDVGKVQELSWDKGAFAYTTEGRLLGHVVLGERLVSTYIDALPDFPEDLRLRISHTLIAHQGETEYGSPERPKTLEALLVHLIDNLDARSAMYMETTTNVSPGGWSHHENPLHRALYVPE